ncbi:MAG: YkgJ family cysteine cluster protein [Desulfobacteraceae bacterium]|nr:YkgJ family cysteine cluster protein [Desulfobacteraceae bacterium]
MKYIKNSDTAHIPGRPLAENEHFSFGCHPGVECFNQCCRNLNLYLYPYDVIRLKNRLEISSGEFVETYTHVVLREQSHFPHVLLAMAENSENTCPFLTDEGCSIYADRPQTCRAYPVEQAVYFEEGRPMLLHYFRPPDFCHGPEQKRYWTVKSWESEQGAGFYNQMAVEWAEIMGLFTQDPWGEEGPSGQKARMAFMAAYNVDDFRRFVLESSFLARFRVKPDVRLKLAHDDVAMLRLGLAWIKLAVFGIRTNQLSPKG